MSYIESLSTTLPILILVILGVFLRKFHFFKDNTVNDIKKLVVNISLPLVLLNAFATMAFEPRYLWIIVSVFSACVIVMAASRKLGAFLHIPSRFFPFLMAGFEAGMMGYAIFGSIYGIENIPIFAIFDLGQVLFVFLVLIPTMQAKDGQRTSVKDTALFFVKTPVILAIFAGIILNISGLYPMLTGFPPGNALIQTTNSLGAITIPLMVMILGYDLKLNLETIGKPLQTAIIRMVVWVGFAFLFNHFILSQILNLGPIYQAAAWMLFILPPGYIIPLFMTQSEETDRIYIANTLSLSTFFALVAVVFVRSVNPVVSMDYKPEDHQNSSSSFSLHQIKHTWAITLC